MGGVSNVDIDGNNTLHIKGIGVAIFTFETLPIFLYSSAYSEPPGHICCSACLSTSDALFSG